MSRALYDLNFYCDWCRKPYKSKKSHRLSRFCSAACKQAHYRAYKKYVTAKSRLPANRYPRAVTQKTRASSVTAQGKK